ncbi:MAG TPA: hypothetical protein DIC34_04760 [Treponema sp.]|nr:MAG: hypothetical protein A2Y36_18520 [Treponema sp. GWA1_62_8]OHE67606.1 MAG: hypothetical protein A2001_19640 [Treponema sp. GWC1_61_84]OHE70520.1 MAG: hypothetical protein A2413_19300 [Treponema sp. RIFOXYC1_FULL_61_9]HCM25847.1 hypothetical protein [Treponema sp.]
MRRHTGIAGKALWLSCVLLFAASSCRPAADKQTSRDSRSESGTRLGLGASDSISDSASDREADRVAESEADSEAELYYLPFPVGTAYTCVQGYDNRSSHLARPFFYAVDFAMPIGTLLTASRGGVVLAIQVGYTDQDIGSVDKANFIIVAHGDDTFSRYIHLTHLGSLVKDGQRIKAGDPVGYSGSSGSPGLPHLHFDVTRGGPMPDDQTIPLRFANTIPHPDGPQSWISYPARPRLSLQVK